MSKNRSNDELSLDTNWCIIRGGGLESNVDMSQNAPSLRWMACEAISAGLSMELPKERWATQALGGVQVHESLTWKWMLLELFPFAPRSGRKWWHFLGR